MLVTQDSPASNENLSNFIKDIYHWGELFEPETGELYQ
jgi:hypothetical protein